MVGPGVYRGKTKPKQMPHRFDETPRDSKAEATNAVPLTGYPLPATLTLNFDTNVRLQRNTVLATVTIVNALVTAALIAAAVPTTFYVQNELNNSQQKIEVLQEQVKFLTDRYEYILKQLSEQRPSSQDRDIDSVPNGEPSQHLQTRIKSLVINDNIKEQQSSVGALGTEETFSPPSFPGKSRTSREVELESAGSQYGTVSLRRTKRSDWRGKQSQRKSSNGGRGRQRRRGKFSGAAVAHFKGGQPETFIRDGGLVAPWFLDDAASGRFSFSAFQLKQGKAAVEVTESGLYYIYSQIHYLTSQVTNSYSLNLRHGSQSNSSVLSYCSASSGSQALNEVSCFTSVVRYLNSTDRVFIQQRDMNRRIILRDGYSYLGVVRLST